jgi:anti-sigma B factor antagonist
MIAGQERRVQEERDERREPAIIDEPGVRSAGPYLIAEGDSTERVRVLVLSGELDLAAAPRLRARIDETTSGRALVLDLSRATFIDSAVLKELLRARAELSERDIRLVLAGVAPPVRRLLDLTRTYELFEDAGDVAEAVRRLS